MSHAQYRTAVGETVTVRGGSWSCSGCNQSGRAKRPNVESDANKHAHSCHAVTRQPVPRLDGGWAGSRRRGGDR